MARIAGAGDAPLGRLGIVSQIRILELIGQLDPVERDGDLEVEHGAARRACCYALDNGDANALFRPRMPRIYIDVPIEGAAHRVLVIVGPFIGRVDFLDGVGGPKRHAPE